jgi:hypothetical protein
VWEAERQMNVSLNRATHGVEWSASRPGRFAQGEHIPGTDSIGYLVSSGTDLDIVERRKNVIHLSVIKSGFI